MFRILTVLIILTALLAGGVYFINQEAAPLSASARIPLAAVMAGTDTAGYARAIHPVDFSFPADHGPHPRFKSEWWYFTGNLQSDDGSLFGYQFTIFRHALSPDPRPGNSAWGSNQLYMAHFTVSDINREAFYSFERFSRSAQGLAGARGAPFRVWINDWYCGIPDSGAASELHEIQLYAAEGDIRLQLDLIREKPWVIQGDRGLSQKGAGSGNASYYYSATRLHSSGNIMVRDKEYTVRGLSWMDREWSTSALAENQIGWDWFSLQLDNGYELMYYQLRRQDGSADSYSRGLLVDPQGHASALSRDDLTLVVTDRWQSPHGGEYPSGWQVDVPGFDIAVTVTPRFASQELDLTIRYWEGAVGVDGHYGDLPVSGSGYVELTGYAQ